MSNLGILTLDLVARIGGFTGPLDQAARQSRKTADEMSKNFGKLKGLFLDIFPAAAAAASIAGITAFVKSSIDAADKLDDLSMSTGVSAETLSTMGWAAKLSGLEMDSLADGFKRLSKAMSETASGTGESKKAFDLLGISVKNNDGSLKSSEKVMLELADRFAGMEDGAGKTALAMKFFGKSGADMIPLLNEGAAGLAKMQQEARDMGIAVSNEAARAAGEFNDNLDRLVANIKGSVLPAVNWFVEGMNRMFNTPDAEKLYVAEKRLQFLREELEQLQRTKPEDFSWWGSLLGKTEKYNKALAEQKKLVEDQEKAVAKLRDAINAPSKPKTAAPVLPDEEAEKKAKQLKDAIDKQIASLREQRDTFNMTGAEATLYKLAMQGATEAQITQARELLVTIAAQKKSAEEFEESQKKVVAAAAAAKKIFEDTRAPIEQYSAEMKDLDEHLNNGAISFETYERAAEAAEKKFTDAVTKTADKGKGKLDELKDAIEGWGRSSADAFAEFAMSGKASFADLADSIIKDILRMVAYQQIFKPMFGAISSGISGLFGAPSPGDPGFIGPTVPSAHGNVFESGKVIPFARGGVINRPVTFPLGLAGEAGPEGIFPLTRIGGDLGVKADLGGFEGPREMKIEIINKSGQPLEVTDAKFNFQDAVISVWVDAYERNKGGLRTRMGG